MTERKSNLGNCAMDVCSICKEPMGIVLQTRDGKDVFDWKREVCTGWICDKCQKIIDENVTLHCETCKGSMVVRVGMMPGFKAGDKYRIYKCPKCSWDDQTIEWLSPEEIERQKNELTPEELGKQDDERDEAQQATDDARLDALDEIEREGTSYRDDE